jgi:CO/xanthine dehydrogenase FAD-binding subunit
VPVGDVLERSASGLHPDELIVELTLGAPDGPSSWGASELSSRTWDPAAGGAVCRIAWDAGGAPADARVVAFGELERPFRLPGVEAAILEDAEPRTLHDAVASEAERAVGAVGALGAVAVQRDRAWLAAVIANSVGRAVEQARTHGGVVAR